MRTILGRCIKEARLISAFTQDDLAQKLGVSPVTVSRWETGINTPSLRRYRQLVEVLNLDPAIIATTGKKGA